MNNDGVATGLAQVRAELQTWRGQRRKGDRIPAAIWRRAARAVQQYGLNPVSQALRLDYYELKRRASGDREPEARNRPVFVELEGVQPDLACVVELEKGNGTRMRICVRETATVDWGKLKEAFLGA